MWNCCHLSASSVDTIQTMGQFTVSLYSKLHTLGAFVFSCNLPPALLAEWLGSFMPYCCNTGGRTVTKIRVITKLTLERKLTLEWNILLPLLSELDHESITPPAPPPPPHQGVLLKPSPSYLLKNDPLTGNHYPFKKTAPPGFWCGWKQGFRLPFKVSV